MTRARRHRLLLLAVVLGFVALSLTLTNLHRYLAYDEAIYLSQVYPGPALPFTAPRARGMPILLAPLGWIDAPLPVIRGYLLLANAGLMYLGFNAWLPVLRGRAVAAAAVFAVAWLPLFYSTEAFPNLPVAFGSLAATGYLARYLCGSGRAALVACAVAVALVALFRPTEATFVTVGLALAAVTRPGRELVVRWSALAVGLLVGWLPWLIEAQLRFGGPLARLRAASGNVGAGLHPENLRYHLGYTDGPMAGVVRGGIPRLGELWWLLMIISIAVLLGRVLLDGLRGDDQGDDQAVRDGRVRRAGAVAAIGGGASASQYLLLTSVLEARFLLPAYALLTVAMLAALPTLRSLSWHRERPATPMPRWAATGTATVLFLAFAVFAQWQLGVTHRIAAKQDRDRQLAANLVAVVRRQSPAPCFVASDLAFPVIAFEAGCRGSAFRPAGTTILVHREPQDRDPAGTQTPPPRVYVLTRTNPARTGVRPTTGSVRSLTSDGAAGWWFFVASPSQVISSK